MKVEIAKSDFRKPHPGLITSGPVLPSCAMTVPLVPGSKFRTIDACACFATEVVTYKIHIIG